MKCDDKPRPHFKEFKGIERLGFPERGTPIWTPMKKKRLTKLANLLMNQLPRYLGSSIHTSALIVALQSVLQIGGMTDVITAISFALKYVDEIRHIVSICRNTPEHSY